jgi:hypothetical protein
MKTCKTGCGGKMKAGGSVKKIKKMADGGSTGLVGMPRYSNNPRSEQGRILKKGGSAKSKGCPPGYYWTIQGCQEMTSVNKGPLSTRSAKLGVGAGILGALGIAGKAIADKVKARKAKKEEEKKKDTATTKAKFGASVNVQRGYPGKIRSAGDQGYTAVGKREPARTKFQDGGKITVINASPNDPYPKEQRRLKAELEKAKKVKAAGIKLAKAKRLAEEKANAKTKASYKEGAKKYQKGGFPDLTGDGKVTKADILKGRGVIKKKGGSVKK